MFQPSSDRSQSSFTIAIEATLITLALAAIATLTSHPNQAKATVQTTGATPTCIEIALRERLTAQVITNATCR